MPGGGVFCYVIDRFVRIKAAGAGSSCGGPHLKQALPSLGSDACQPAQPIHNLVIVIGGNLNACWLKF